MKITLSETRRRTDGCRRTGWTSTNRVAERYCPVVYTDIVRRGWPPACRVGRRGVVATQSARPQNDRVRLIFVVVVVVVVVASVYNSLQMRSSGRVGRWSQTTIRLRFEAVQRIAVEHVEWELNGFESKLNRSCQSSPP